jgi:hypothetical protein
MKIAEDWLAVIIAFALVILALVGALPSALINLIKF